VLCWGGANSFYRSDRTKVRENNRRRQENAADKGPAQGVKLHLSARMHVTPHRDVYCDDVAREHERYRAQGHHHPSRTGHFIAARAREAIHRFASTGALKAAIGGEVAAGPVSALPLAVATLLAHGSGHLHGAYQVNYSEIGWCKEQFGDNSIIVKCYKDVYEPTNSGMCFVPDSDSSVTRYDRPRFWPARRWRSSSNP